MIALIERKDIPELTSACFAGAGRGRAWCQYRCAPGNQVAEIRRYVKSKDGSREG